MNETTSNSRWVRCPLRDCKTREGNRQQQNISLATRAVLRMKKQQTQQGLLFLVREAGRRQKDRM